EFRPRGKNWRGGGCLESRFEPGRKKRCRSFNRAPRIILAGVATSNRPIAPRIKDRIRKRHRALQRTPPVGHPSKDWQQRGARCRSRAEIDEAISGREGPANRVESSRLSRARRVSAKITKRVG